MFGNNDEEVDEVQDQPDTGFLANLNPIYFHIYELIYRSYCQMSYHLHLGTLFSLECFFSLLSYFGYGYSNSVGRKNGWKDVLKIAREKKVLQKYQENEEGSTEALLLPPQH